MRRNTNLSPVCVLGGLLVAAIAACGGEPAEGEAIGSMSRAIAADEAEPVEEKPIGSASAVTTLYAVKCWQASLYDLDSDGYADRFANSDWRVTFYRPSNLIMSCPTGYVMARGDCDDGDPAVHPRRTEVYGNGVDDNCDGRVDEPTLDYSFDGFNNTTNGFTLRVRVHDPMVAAAYSSISKRLYYEVEYQKLSATGTTYTTGKRRVTTLSTFVAYRRTEIALTGLAATTVYRARVRFFSAPIYTLATYTPIGETSDWYYTTTSGTTAVSLARTEILLRGLYELYLSLQLGYTGYMGLTYVDGTRYLAEEDVWWCSEFYSWAADHAITIGYQSSVNKVKTYFEGHTAYSRVTSFDLVKSTMARGDYLALDTNLDGEPNHSGMVLDYDTDQGVLWTLEGNTSGFTDIGDGYDNRRAGNETMVRTRTGGEVHGWGSIRSSMLD